jgi:hypothetical protein
MPDPDRPAAKSPPEASPGEFDFALPSEENSRVRKRSLRPRTEVKLKPDDKTAPAARELERDALSRSVGDRDDKRESEERMRPPPASASGQPHFAGTARPDGMTTERVSPHGNRPATLYYSTGANKDSKETASPMKSTSPTPSSSSAASSPLPTRAPTVHDYRTNLERQSREQKSIGNLLAIVVYVLIGFFVIGSSLAGYGIYALSKQIKQQSLTIGDLDRKYASENQKLDGRLQATLDNLTQAQAQIGRQQALILQEQEAINRLSAANDVNAAALRQERAARADEEADLRARIRDLEYHGGTTTQRY